MSASFDLLRSCGCRDGRRVGRERIRVRRYRSNPWVSSASVFRRSSHHLISTFVRRHGACARSRLSSWDAAPPARSGNLRRLPPASDLRHAPLECPADVPGCLSWDDFDGPPGAIVRSSSGAELDHLGAQLRRLATLCSRAMAPRAAMAPGSRKNSVWLATIDSGRATGLVVDATITLSPTPLRANVGLVALFADRKNHVVCKLEVSHGRPEPACSLLATNVATSRHRCWRLGTTSASSKVTHIA